MLKDKFAFWPSRHRVAVVVKSLGERLRGLDFTLPAFIGAKYRAEREQNRPAVRLIL